MATTRIVQKLMEDAYELLDSYSCDQAVKIGLKLLKLGYSGAYEILALAYYRNGERQRAMETLVDGLKKAPDVWLFWQLIGNIYSDDGKYVEAYEAFARSLSCPGVDESWVRYNQAVALSRQERYLESLAECLQVSNSELELDCITLTVSLLNSLGRWDEALDLTKSLIARIPPPETRDQENEQILGSAYTQLARCLWEGKKDGDGALAAVREALELNRSEQLAMRIMREIRGLKSEASGWFKVVVEGRWHEPLPGDSTPPGFFTSCEVVAENADECLALAAEFEPEPTRASLKMQRCDRLEACPDNLKGVYWRSGYAFFKKKAGKTKAKAKAKR